MTHPSGRQQHANSLRTIQLREFKVEHDRDDSHLLRTMAILLKNLAALLALTALSLCPIARSASAATSTIDRKRIVARYNPMRTASSASTPMQVGNGDFAFGADVTGLQTFLPWAIMSSWGWQNDSLPAGKTWADVENYKGASWDFHGRLVQYEFDGADAAVQQWLTANPNRVNLGRIGLVFGDGEGTAVNVTEAELQDVRQEIDLWTGTMSSEFSYNGERVSVKTYSAQSSSTVGIVVKSALVASGRLGVFLDFPWNDGANKFSAPFVGSWNMTSNHTTILDLVEGRESNIQAQISHTLVNSTFITSVGGTPFSISRDSSQAHRYSLFPKRSSATFELSVDYSLDAPSDVVSVDNIVKESTAAWEGFWSQGGFVDVYTGSTDSRAAELQRRIILSRYLMRVNEAGDLPPQEVSSINA